MSTWRLAGCVVGWTVLGKGNIQPGESVLVLAAANAPANHVLVKNYSLVDVHMGGYREADPSPFEQCYEDIYQLLIEGKIDPLIGERVTMADLPRALKDLAERRTTGRVVLDPRS